MPLPAEAGWGLRKWAGSARTIIGERSWGFGSDLDCSGWGTASVRRAWPRATLAAGCFSVSIKDLSAERVAGGFAAGWGWRD
jgi:hypothetical protein